MRKKRKNGEKIKKTNFLTIVYKSIKIILLEE